MPINSSHEFSTVEIEQIENAGFTVAAARQFLSDWSVNGEGAAELEFDTMLGGMIKARDSKPVLDSYIDNEVSDDEARPQEQEKSTGSVEGAD
jgi:hypothetical protein